MTMTLLFSLHLSSNKKGFGKPSVRGEPSALIGVWDSKQRKLVKPCAESVRAALPHYYRKAFDRSGGNFWFNKHALGIKQEKASAPYLHLRDSRGRWINTIYAIPYDFEVNHAS